MEEQQTKHKDKKKKQHRRTFEKESNIARGTGNHLFIVEDEREGKKERVREKERERRLKNRGKWSKKTTRKNGWRRRQATTHFILWLIFRGIGG